MVLTMASNFNAGIEDDFFDTYQVDEDKLKTLEGKKFILLTVDLLWWCIFGCKYTAW